jgi:ketosteroid isomerase-like protein
VSELAGDPDSDGALRERVAQLEGRLAKLEAHVERLADIEAITQLRARYTRAVDTKDWDAWRDTMTEGVVQVNDTGVTEGRDAVVAAVAAGTQDGSMVHHLLTPEIEITGPDTARGTWATEDLVRLTVRGAPFEYHGYGHYHEEYVRTADGWRVSRSEETRLRVDQLAGAWEAPDA